MMRVLPASWSSSSAPSSSSSSKDPSSNRTTSSSSAAAVYLNIYDISPLNHYLYWFGLGIFHSGIEGNQVNFTIYLTTNINTVLIWQCMAWSTGLEPMNTQPAESFEVEPKNCPGFIFRRSVCVGSTDMSRSQVRTAIEDLAEDYHGDTYHLIIKNCNHFTADVCKRLTGKPVPGWVNRLAKLGSFFNCILPESIKASSVVRDATAHHDFSDDDLGSNASIIDGSDEDDLDHLLTTPNSDVIPSRDRTLTPARDSF